MTTPTTAATAVPPARWVPSAYLPIMLSMIALSAVLYHMARYGISPEAAAHGGAAKIWPLCMALQIPIVLFHAVKWLWKAPRIAVKVIALEIVAAICAMAPVTMMGWSPGR